MALRGASGLELSKVLTAHSPCLSTPRCAPPSSASTPIVTASSTSASCAPPSLRRGSTLPPPRPRSSSAVTTETAGESHFCLDSPKAYSRDSYSLRLLPTHGRPTYVTHNDRIPTAAVSWSSPSSPISSARCARRRVTRWPPSSARCVRSSASRLPLRRPRDPPRDDEPSAMRRGCGARLGRTDCNVFRYSPPSRPLGSLTPTQPERVTNPNQGHPGSPWGAPQVVAQA